ncbi:MAG: DUF2520 domain-containing protein [Solirubrobacterales bacterium]
MNERKSAPQALTIVGPGRVGSSIANAAQMAGFTVDLVARKFTASQVDSRAVLLCVPDSEIVPTAERIAALGATPKMLGHTSGATGLEPLRTAGAPAVFSIHPLQTVPAPDTDLSGCPAAVAGSNPEAVDFATRLARDINLLPFEIDEKDRPTYHAAASLASNYLITLEQTAASMLEEIGVKEPRRVLAPLVRRSLSNWEELGAAAITGPIARGDEGTVEAHRTALATTNPDLLEMYDAMADRTRAMVSLNGADPQ